jgi:hypothetical protein
MSALGLLEQHARNIPFKTERLSQGHLQESPPPAKPQRNVKK